MEPLDLLAAAQHADQPPDAMIMDRGRLARPPDEADDAEPLATVAMEQILLITIGIRPGIVGRQPVVARDQARKQRAAAFQQGLFVAGAGDQIGQGRDETAQPTGIDRPVDGGDGVHSAASAWRAKGNTPSP